MQSVEDPQTHELTDALYFVWQTDGYITDFIRLADTKSAAMLAVTGGILGFLIDRLTTQGSLDMWQWVLAGVAGSLDVLTIVAAFLVVAPRRSIPRSGLPVVQDLSALLQRQPPVVANGADGLIYWEHVAKKTPAEYRASIMGLSRDGMLEQVVEHCLASAHVAVRKYALLRSVFALGIPGLALSGVFLLTL